MNTKKVPHPAKAAGCTRAQIDAFNQIAAGQSQPVCAKRTLVVLVSCGLIEFEEVCVSSCALGNIYVKQYYVPTHVHMQWAQWCSEACKGEDGGSL